MSQRLTIKDFKGVNLREGLWDQGYASEALNCDLFGIGNDTNNISIPGVLQAGLSMSAGVYAAPLSGIVADFARYANDSSLYAFTDETTGKLYRYTNSNNTWTQVSSINVSGIGRNLMSYNNHLYYASNLYLGDYDGTNGNANFQAFSAASNPTPMKVFAGALYIANSRYIDKYDGTTYSSHKLTLPADFAIRSIEVFRDALYISADNGFYSRLFIWDGASPTYNDQIPLDQEARAPQLIAAQGYLWIVGTRGIGSNRITALTPIYVMQYQVPQLLFTLPINRDSSYDPATGMAAYANGILIGSSEGTSSSSYESGVGGLWYIGKNNDSDTFSAVLMYVPQSIPIAAQIGGVMTGGSNNTSNAPLVLLGWKDTLNGIFHIYSAQTFSNLINSTGSGMYWSSLPIDAGNTNRKLWHDIQLNFDDLTTSQSVIVSYRLDNATSWTALKTFTSSNPSSDWKAFIPIRKKSRTIAIQIKFSSVGGIKSPKCHGFSLGFSTLPV